MLRWLWTPLLVAAATGFTLLAAELAARLLAPQWAPQHAERRFWEHDPQLGWAHRPGQQGELRHPDFSVRVEISEQGFRDRAYPEVRVAGRPRMLVLGDSFAWGFGVEQEEILWTRIEARHPRWEIIDTAVSGYGTDQALLFFEERGAALRPDVVVLHFHPNDVEDNADDRRYGYPKPRFTLEAGELVLGNVPVPSLSAPWRLRRWLGEHSYLFNRLRAVEALLDARGPRSLRLAGVGGTAPQAGAAPPQSGFAVSEALLRRLAASVREAGARLVVVSNPAPEPVRELLSRTLADLAVPYLSLEAAFRGPERSALKFLHDPHWTAAGHAVAADAVEAFLLEIGVLP